MLNLFLGIPRHVWLGPYDLSPSAASNAAAAAAGNAPRNHLIDLKMDNSNLTMTNDGTQSNNTNNNNANNNTGPNNGVGPVVSMANTFGNNQASGNSSSENSSPIPPISANSFPSMVSQAIQGIANNQQQPRPPNVGTHSHKGSGGGGKFQCKMCNLVFLHKSAMQLHAKEVHRGELKPFQCQQCLKSFSSHHQLGQHNRIHTGEKPYKCHFCDRCFKQLSHLQQHIRLHTGERPYKCSMPNCGRSFIQLANLQQHLRNHDNQTKNRPYHCDICGKGFVAEVSLMTHMTTQHALMAGQGLLPCTVCHHLFGTREMLAEHISSKH